MTPVRIFLIGVLWAALLAGVTSPMTPGGGAARAEEASEDDWKGLPPGKGREETFYLCGACHSLKLVVQQGLSRDSWDESIDWMIEEQEMDPPEAAERKLIVDYLAKFYGRDRLARRLVAE